MHAINGFIYGSLPNLTVCVNETIAWYFVGLGNTFDLHSMNFEGLSLDFHHRRKSSVAVFPADFLSATMVADGPLKTLLVCDVYHHFKAGLMALLKVEMCEDKQSERIPDELLVPTRTYYISAEEIVWDYGPTGINQFSEQPLDTDEEASYFFSKENNTIGGKYLKAVYHEYTDSTFEVVAPKDDNLGILGPVIYAEVGDLVEVVFKNSLDIIASINPQGILVQGSHMLTDPLEVQGVVPGDIVTYMWPISVNIGPLEWDPPCISRIYVSAVDPKHVFAGLVGPIVICKKGQLDTLRQSQIGIDREFFMLFAIFNENLSPYLDKNIAKFCENPEEVDKTREHFKESNKKYAINGFMFGNLPGLSVCVGETIVWHILGIGNTNDLHVAHFHGNTFQIDNSNKDTISVIPGVTRTLTMTVDNPGDWPIDCGTTTNFVSGMRAIMSAEMCFERINSALPTIKNKERVYYIGAVEEVWNYSPVLMHPINGFNLTVDINGHLFVVRDDTHIGSTYKKVFYREFTDETFSIQKPSAPGLGLLGPIIKAEVGDTLRIKFKNMAMRNYSFYAHGMMYNAPRAEPFEDLGVAPGQVYEYVMDIPDRSGPGSGDFNCTTWSYFSAVDPIKDPMSGLIGILVTCRSGILNAEGMRTDVQREFAVLFAIIEESLSWYLDENIQTYCGKPSEVHKDDEDFKFSNRMHSTNGYIYDNLPGLEMMNGDRVAFYLLGFGDHLNIHTIHFHGESFWHRDIEGNRVDDVTNVYPDTTSTVELIADSPGEWLLHCHVNDHIRYGMVASYIIHPRS